jgi:hypothetical protein
VHRATVEMLQSFLTHSHSLQYFVQLPKESRTDLLFIGERLKSLFEQEEDWEMRCAIVCLFRFVISAESVSSLPLFFELCGHKILNLALEDANRLVRLETNKILKEIQGCLSSTFKNVQMSNIGQAMKMFLELLKDTDFDTQIQTHQVHEVYNEDDEIYSLLKDSEENVLDCPD